MCLSFAAIVGSLCSILFPPKQERELFFLFKHFLRKKNLFFFFKTVAQAGKMSNSFFLLKRRDVKSVTENSPFFHLFYCLQQHQQTEG